MISEVRGERPVIEKGVFIARNATVLGEVKIGKGCGIWFNAVIRGDSNSISIGAHTNIQDLCMLHVDNKHPLRIGDDVTVGHRATLHGCTIGNRVLVGMSSTVMNGAVIGDDSIVGAGALVTENTIVPARSLVIGFPAKVKRQLTDHEIELIRASAKHYAEYASWYLEAGFSE